MTAFIMEMTDANGVTRRIRMQNLGGVGEEALLQGVQLIRPDGSPENFSDLVGGIGGLYGSVGSELPTLPGGSSGFFGLTRSIDDQLRNVINGSNQVRVVIEGGGSSGGTSYQAGGATWVPPGMAIQSYTANMVMGGLYEVTNILRGTDPHLWISNVRMVTGLGDATFNARLIVFHDNPNNTTFTNGATLSIHANDRLKFAGHIDFVRQVIGSVSVLRPATGELPLLVRHASNTSMWCVVQNQGTINMTDTQNLRITLAGGY